MLTYDSVETLAEAAAGAFVEICQAAIADHGRAFVALSGGNTPKAMFAALTKKELDWSKVEFFWSDERSVGPSDTASNFRLANDTLLTPIEAKHVHRLQGEAENLDRAASDYESEIRRTLGNRPFDLVLLGLGEDAHTASLFPFTPALDEQRRWVVANPVEKLKTTRLTFTFPLLNAADNVMFLVAGKDKAGALAKVWQGVKNVHAAPAQGITAAHVHWFIDAPAISALEGPL